MELRSTHTKEEKKRNTQRTKSTLCFAANYSINLKVVQQNLPNIGKENMPLSSRLFVVWFVCVTLNKTVRIELFAIYFSACHVKKKGDDLAKILKAILEKT